MHRNRLPFLFVTVFSFILISMQGGALDDASQSIQELKNARQDESPVALKRILAQSLGNSVEKKLSQAFLDSRISSDLNALQTLESWLQNHPAAPPEDRLFAYKQLGSRYMAFTLYAKATDAYEKAAALTEGNPDSDLEDALDLAKIATTVPPIRKRGATGAELNLERDLARLNRIHVDISGTISPMIIDTGAEISVAARSVAEKSNMQFLDGDVTVGTTTDNVVGQLAVSNTVDIGGMVFQNVLFLVLPDDLLTFADGQYFVDGIIGLPIFITAQRMGWTKKATKLLLGDKVHLSDDKRTPIYWHDGGMALELKYNEVAFPAFFDSGASSSSGTVLLKSLLSVRDKSSLLTNTEIRTGVGGAVETKTHRLPEITLALAGENVVLTNIRVASEKLNEPDGDIAIIGSDILARTQSFFIDFKAMTYELELAPSE